MIEITHHIQKSILKYLTKQQTARYSQMRPPKVDSNLYAYHLKSLLKAGFIIKNDKDYSLSPSGLNYVETVSLDKFQIHSQPKITTRILLKNHNNQFLLTKRNKQPLIGMWGFISGKIQDIDNRIIDSAQREIYEKTNLNIKSLDHIGDYYAKILSENEVISNTLSHVFTVQIPKQISVIIPTSESQNWFSYEKMVALSIMPDTLDLIYLSSHSDGKFFAELEYEI
ncbi:MAG: NUDIX domain-containing protein [Candidatus Nanogingivalis sp.]